MLRPMFLAILALGLLRLPGAFTDPPPRKPAGPDKPGKAAKESRAVELRRQLALPVTLSFDETPLKDALAVLSEKYGLTILVDAAAFQADVNLANVEDQPVKLPKVTSVRLDTVLTQLTAQVQGSFLVKGDHIAITTAARVRMAVWGQVEGVGGKPRPLMPLVRLDLNQRPLDAALRDLTEATGVSIVLDARRAGDKAKAAVTASLNNVPLDTAVRLLANQADLKAVLRDHSLDVTTADRADSLLPEPAPVQPAAAPAAFQRTVSLKLDGTPLGQVLQDLTRETGLQLVLDPQAGVARQKAITLDVEGVTVETALHLLTEMADLKMVPIGNVAFVTTLGKATRLETEQANKMKWNLQMMKDGGLAGLNLTVGGGGIMGASLGIGGGSILGISGGSGTGAAPAVRIGTFPTAVKAEPVQLLPARTATPLHRLLNTLARPINLEKGFEADTPLKDVLNWLRDKYELPILVNDGAFKTDLNQADVESQAVKLPKMTNVRLSTVLDKVLAQVQGTYLVRADHLEITTLPRAQMAVWGKIEAEDDSPTWPAERLRMPVVQAAIPNLPLHAAVKELADATGMSVIVDAHRVGDKAQAVVSGPLVNVPMDTAVRLLADQVGLEVAVLDDVLYVTTPANARTLRTEQQKANQQGLEPGPESNPPGGA